MPSTRVKPVPVVVLISGSGSILQALIDAAADPDYGIRIAAVGSDRDGAAGLQRAQGADIATFVCRMADYGTRADWDVALAGQVAASLPEGLTRPHWVLTAGFMKLLGPQMLADYTVLNTHPALLPAFPGTHAVADALAYGVRVTGTTVHLLDAGTDTGPIVAQRVVPVRREDDEASLHERIKTVERDLMVRTARDMIIGGYTLHDRKVTLA